MGLYSKTYYGAYMDIFTLFSFVGGLGLFLFGMNVLSEAIRRQAGGKLKIALEKITSNKIMGIALGAGVTFSPPARRPSC